VNLYMEFISTSQDSTLKTVTMAAVSKERPHDSNDIDFARVKADMSVEDRYYKTKVSSLFPLLRRKGFN
jgi:hypothetical protein